MNPRTQFMALRPDPEDDTRTSVEMINMRSPNHEQHEDEPRKWSKSDRKTTFRERLKTPFPWKLFFIISSLPFALAPIVVLSTAAETASVGYILGRDCYPNGKWSEVHGATWRIMDSSYFFTPNLSFGSMTFTQVKVIDIAWDLLVGRGGQLLLAWVNYRVFNEWILYHMELHLTSYKLYTAVAFETTSMSTLGVLGKEFLAFGQSNWRRLFRWLAILSMLLSTLYVLSFPTLMAAMTGYITTYQAYIEDYNQNLLSLNEVLGRPIAFIIQDSQRIGDYSKPFIITRDNDDLIRAVCDYVSATDSSDNFTDCSLSPFTDDTTQDQIKTFFVNTTSKWSYNGENRDLKAPSLNITWLANMTSDLSPKIRYFYYTDEEPQGDIYNATWIYDHGSCQPSEEYQWGFSYIFLFMVSIFNFIWSCIMVGMWFDTSRASRMYKGGRRPGLLRSVLDLSRVLREEVGERVESMEEEELRQALRHSDGSLVIPKGVLKVTRTGTGNDAVKQKGWRRRMTKGSTF